MAEAMAKGVDQKNRRRERKDNCENDQRDNRPTPAVRKVQRVSDSVALPHEKRGIIGIDVENSPLPALFRNFHSGCASRIAHGDGWAGAKGRRVGLARSALVPCQSEHPMSSAVTKV